MICIHSVDLWELTHRHNNPSFSRRWQKSVSSNKSREVNQNQPGSARNNSRDTLCYSEHAAMYCGGVTRESDLNIMATPSHTLRLKSSVKHQRSMVQSHTLISSHCIKPQEQQQTAAPVIKPQQSVKQNRCRQEGLIHACTYLCIMGEKSNRHTPIHRKTEGNVHTRTLSKDLTHTQCYPNSDSWTERHYGFGCQWRASSMNCSDQKNATLISPICAWPYIYITFPRWLSLGSRNVGQHWGKRKRGQAEQQESGAE